jgi:hypothetical protein
LAGGFFLAVPSLLTGNWKLATRPCNRTRLAFARAPETGKSTVERQFRDLQQNRILAQNGRKKPLSPQFPAKSHEVAHKHINSRKKASLQPLTSKKKQAESLHPRTPRPSSQT